MRLRFENGEFNLSFGGGIRDTVAHAVVGWLRVRIVTQVFPFFEIRSWGVRPTVLAIVVGFPIALVITCAFEAAPGNQTPRRY
jgi:hypothetical protein